MVPDGLGPRPGLGYPMGILNPTDYHAMHHEYDSDLAHWVLEGTSFLGGDVAGLRTPDEAVALLIDGYSTGDGKQFDAPPFGAGTANVTMVVLPEEVGDRIYERLSGYIGGRKSKKENLAEENEVLAAKWNLGNGSVAVLAADGGGAEYAQDVLEDYLRLERIPLHSSGFAVIAPGMDASVLLENPMSVIGDKAREMLESLCLESASPAPARPPRL